MKTTALLALSTLALPLVACTDDAGAPGTIQVMAWGEGYIEDGIPAEDVSDGWAIAFDEFTVSIGGTAAKAGEGGGEVGDTDMKTVDLAIATNGTGTEIASYAAPAGAYDHFGYRLEQLHVRGSASKPGAATKTFDWTFPMRLAYAHCEMAAMIDGNTTTMTATIHADHLFYDDAVSDEPGVAFDIFAAADTDGDHVVTLDELAVKDITTEARYQVGSLREPITDLTITNLKQYVFLQATTVGHINGEGHCEDVIVQP